MFAFNNNRCTVVSTVNTQVHLINTFPWYLTGKLCVPRGNMNKIIELSEYFCCAISSNRRLWCDCSIICVCCGELCGFRLLWWIWFYLHRTVSVVELSAFAYIYEMLFESAPDKLVSGTQRQRQSRKKPFRFRWIQQWLYNVKACCGADLGKSPPKSLDCIGIKIYTNTS